MTMNEWVEMLQGIKDGVEVKIPAQLHIRGQLQGIINSLGGINTALIYFQAVSTAEPADIEKEVK